MADEKKIPERSVKIENFCGKCEHSHEVTGTAAIYAVITEAEAPHFSVSAGTLSVFGPQELEVLLSSLLQAIWNQDRYAFIAAINNFSQNAEGFKFDIQNKGPIN